MRNRNRMLMVLAVAVAALALVAAIPLQWLIRTAVRDVDDRTPLAPGFSDDASRLNQTAVAEIWDVPVDTVNPEQQIAELLSRAREEGLRVSIAGARHSMGGHTIYPGGIVLNMLPYHGMTLDEGRNILRVQSGALWRDVIDYLDQRGRSVEVMQSNNSFTVGGSLSVNCHGWQFDRPPIASTVQSFRLMLADGSVVQCSRTENPELFSLALGGYGLFGVILDVELRVVPNERYRLEQYVVPADQALATFDSKIRGRSDAQLVYARMNIVPDTFLQQVIVNAFVCDSGGDIPQLATPGIDKLRRLVFRGSAESDFGKSLRWTAETKLQPMLADEAFSRNQLLNEGVEVFENRSNSSTDILHEYFLPRPGVERFMEAVRRIIPQHKANLVNVTVRSVNEDPDTFLRFADQPMIAFVMLFVQQRTAAGEAQMRETTRELIDAALNCGGRYYLPYRLHATREQFERAYPKGQEFFEYKRKYDPDELFQNEFYREYGLPH